MNAADFVAGMRRLVDPATASPYAQVFEPVVNATAIVRGEKPADTLGVSAPDDRTVVIRLGNPAPYLLGLLAQPGTFPVHGPSLAQHGAEYARPGSLVSNGAFVLADWIVGSHVVAERNRALLERRGRPASRGCITCTTPTPAPSSASTAPASSTSPTSCRRRSSRWIKENLPGELHVSPQLSVYYYGFNLTRPPFKDNPGLRRALSMVIDRERLTKCGHRASARRRPTAGCRAASANYTPQQFDYAAMPYAERVRRGARAVRRRRAIRPRSRSQVEIRYNSGEVHNRLAVAIAAMWKEALGVETTLYAEEFRALLQSIQARKDTQVFRSSWVGDYNDAYTFAQLLQTGFGINLTGYSNPRYDALLEEATRQADPARRRALLEEAERRDARGSPAAADLLLRQQAPREAVRHGLDRQRHERAVQQGPRASAGG